MTVQISTDTPPAIRDALNIGYALWKEEKYSDALDHYLGSVDLFRTGDKLVETKFHVGIGNVYEQMGESDQAWSHYQSALLCAKSIGDRLGQGIAENDIAFLLIRLDRGDEAHKWLNDAEESFKTCGDLTALAQTQETRAALLQKEFAYRRAVKSICQSILTLIDGIEYDPLLESLTRAEQVIRAYRIQAALESAGSVARAAKKLEMTRQNLERILKTEFPELEVYAVRGERRGVHAQRGK